MFTQSISHSYDRVLLMDTGRRRRVFLATIGSGLVSGCLSSLAENTTPGDEETNMQCDIETGRWQGEAQPIGTEVSIEQTDTLERRCGTEAADAAFSELDQQLDLDLNNKSWAEPMWGTHGEDTVEVRFRFVLNRDGSVQTCPADEVDIATARANLPSEATVTLLPNQSDDAYECTHKVELHSEIIQLD